MGFGLHTIAHLGGDVASPLLNGVGAVSGVGSLTDLGHNIGSPVATLSNAGGILSQNNPAFSGGSYSGTNNTGGGGGNTTKNNGGQATTQPSGPVTDASSGASGTSAQDAASYGLYAGQAQDALSRALASWNATQNGVNQQYGTNLNQLQSGLNAAQSSHDQGVTQTQQDRLSASNQANQSAGSSYQSLLRLLGGMGAGGGSEARLLAPQLIQQELSQNLGGVGETFAKNNRALDTTLGNYKNDESNQEKQLNDWKATQLANGQAGYQQNQQTLAGLLAGLNSHAAPAADLGSQVASVAGNIPNVASINPTYNGQTPVYQAPTLDSYTAGQAPIAQVAQQAAGGTVSPIFDLLTGQKKDQQAA